MVAFTNVEQVCLIFSTSMQACHSFTSAKCMLDKTCVLQTHRTGFSENKEGVAEFMSVHADTLRVSR